MNLLRIREPTAKFSRDQLSLKAKRLAVLAPEALVACELAPWEAVGVAGRTWVGVVEAWSCGRHVSHRLGVLFAAPTCTPGSQRAVPQRPHQALAFAIRRENLLGTWRFRPHLSPAVNERCYRKPSSSESLLNMIRLKSNLLLSDFFSQKGCRRMQILNKVGPGIKISLRCVFSTG